MWGALISLAGSVVGSVLGQQSAADQQHQVNKELRRQRKDLDNWYWNTKGDKMERADMQELARIMRENVMERNEAAENPVAQNTEEAKMALREQNNKDIASTARAVTSTLATEDAANDKSYLDGKNGIRSKKIGISQQQAQNITNATGQMVNSLVNTAGKFVDGMEGGSHAAEQQGSGQPTGETAGTVAGGTRAAVAEGTRAGGASDGINGNTKGGLGGYLNKGGVQLNGGNVYDKQWENSLFNPNAWKNN